MRKQYYVASIVGRTDRNHKWQTTPVRQAKRNGNVRYFVAVDRMGVQGHPMAFLIFGETLSQNLAPVTVEFDPTHDNGSGRKTASLPIYRGISMRSQGKAKQMAILTHVRSYYPSARKIHHVGKHTYRYVEQTWRAERQRFPLVDGFLGAFVQDGGEVQVGEIVAESMFTEPGDGRVDKGVRVPRVRCPDPFHLGRPGFGPSALAGRARDDGHASLAAELNIAGGVIFPARVVGPMGGALLLVEIHDFRAAGNTGVDVFLVGQEDDEGICVVKHPIDVASDEEVVKPVSRFLRDPGDVVWVSDIQPGPTGDGVGNTGRLQFGVAPHVVD